LKIHLKSLLYREDMPRLFSVSDIHCYSTEKLSYWGLVNPVRNSSGALAAQALAQRVKPRPAYRQAGGIILKPNPAAEQRGIISNGVNLEPLPLLVASFFSSKQPLGMEKCLTIR
jgi:hypothetical protein